MLSGWLFVVSSSPTKMRRYKPSFQHKQKGSKRRQWNGAGSKQAPTYIHWYILTTTWKQTATKNKDEGAQENRLVLILSFFIHLHLLSSLMH
jgi:hypothetical protein